MRIQILKSESSPSIRRLKRTEIVPYETISQTLTALPTNGFKAFEVTMVLSCHTLISSVNGHTSITNVESPIQTMSVCFESATHCRTKNALKCVVQNVSNIPFFVMVHITLQCNANTIKQIGYM